ncbi:MAG: YggS family pyridoxal phosphate-dependent enzyme [Chloroflexi bacterium]|nr:YggS family pyridoxal phosphate-dependent enzyme [Chloroflexota bacterium]
MNDLESRVRAVQQRITAAAARAKRDPDSITLVAICKTWPADAVLEAYSCGLRQFGENRVEEARDKIPEVNRRLEPASQGEPPGIVWHLVGHLQGRKAKEAVGLFDLIHSIDSVALARRVDERAAAIGRTIPCLLEINVSGETSKYGFSGALDPGLQQSVKEIVTLEHIDVQGLMTVAPIVTKPDDARPFFRALAELRDELRGRFPGCGWRHLSMGMTDDFEAAIAEGATLVRIGRAIFGERN